MDRPQALMIDLEGTVYTRDGAIGGIPGALSQLREAAMRCASSPILTPNRRRPFRLCAALRRRTDRAAARQILPLQRSDSPRHRGAAASVRTVQVRTGKFALQDDGSGQAPDYVINSLADLPGLLSRKARAVS